ncbi:MAG: hypothetical protein H6672_21105 [Anaerolineaceae bacterium]|nr:hypothetical protein [Anaerolineaceae bacterium]
MLFALIIPVISLIVLWRESKLLLENPRMVVSGDGLRCITRSGEMHWNWADFSDVKITWNTAWFYIGTNRSCLLSGREEGRDAG